MVEVSGHAGGEAGRIAVRPGSATLSARSTGGTGVRSRRCARLRLALRRISAARPSMLLFRG